MARTLTQRELRNESGEIMRRLDSGESFVVTRRGVPVGELIPVRRRRFTLRDDVLQAFAGVAPVDADQLRRELDEFVSQDIERRA